MQVTPDLPESTKMKKLLLLALVLLTTLLLATGCIPDLPGPIGIPGI
jgi:hypothetical protein